MKIYNSLGRKVEEFKPLQPGLVKLYTCGPTVYDFAHIGNLRSFVFNDTLRRTLEFLGSKVAHVMNITDVGHLASDADEGEDKLEKGAVRENKTVWEVADFYVKAFEADTFALNNLPPNGYRGPHGIYARATDFIAEQLDIVKILLEKGFAYITEQAIYFEVTKLPDYGKLTGQKLTDKEIAARSEVVTDHNKHHPQDFALWFFKTGRFENHSMSWPSPWGEGFPGWHLECSAIIHATLGEPLDIHTGGVDHIGTHHTNEIAQTEAAFGVELAKYWVHNEHLLAANEKMSKSKNNYYTLKDITERGYDALTLRLLFLQSHYRSQANFTWEALDAAAVFLKNLQAFADLRFQDNASAKENLGASYEAAQAGLKSAMANDLNSAAALSFISSLINQSEENGIDRLAHTDLIETVDKLFGLKLLDRQDIPGESIKVLMDRERAREAKDWAKADELRSQLKTMGLEVNDTSRGPIWRRI